MVIISGVPIFRIFTVSHDDVPENAQQNESPGTILSIIGSMTLE